MRYDYKGFHNCNCVCDRHIDLDGKIVVFVERWDNAGTSVTNMIEYLAVWTAQELKLPLEELTVFEIYDEFSYKQRKHKVIKSDIEISLVTFELINHQYYPTWKHIVAKDFFDSLRSKESKLLESFKHLQ